jgi:hypothetical protein
MPVAVIGDSQDTIHRADGSADTGANNTPDRAAYGAGDAVTFVRPLPGTPDDALGVAGLRQASQGKEDGGGCEHQAGEQTCRQVHGGDTSFVHFRSQGVSGGESHLSR